MTWHLIEGPAGCEFAKANGCVAVIVDALRASATAANLLENGATEILVVASIDRALEVKQKHPDMLLFGERDGIPPGGFDHGNSPREAAAARGRAIAFTTTTGTQRILEAAEAAAVYVGTTVNALGVVQATSRHVEDVVLIPAGKAGDEAFDADEDWAAAAFIASLADTDIGEGALECRDWQRRVEWDGIPTLFQESFHGQALRDLGLEDDVVWCAQVNIVRAVPRLVRHDEDGAILKEAFS